MNQFLENQMSTHLMIILRLSNKLTSSVKTLTEKIAPDNGEGNDENMLATATKSRSDNRRPIWFTKLLSVKSLATLDENLEYSWIS